MNLLKEIFEQLIQHHSLENEQTRAVMTAIMNGELSDCQIAAFLALMRAKGHTVTELTTAAQVMKEHAHLFSLGENLVDLVGTGGDGLNTFNISTFASFVVAGAGVNIAKHGNRSVSSSSGSSDVLDSAGIHLSADPERLQNQLQQTGLCFLFAPHFHPAMKHAVNARRELGIRTLFNLLGPLLNPAQVKRQVIGVFSAQWLEPISEVLVNLGSQRHLVLHAEDGMDEISVQAPTTIMEYDSGKRSVWSLDPEDYGCAHSSVEEILVHSPKESLEIGLRVLNGEQGCGRDMVCLNAAAAIYCSQDSLSYADALVRAQSSIDSKKALLTFHRLQQLSSRE